MWARKKSANSGTIGMEIHPNGVAIAVSNSDRSSIEAVENIEFSDANAATLIKQWVSRHKLDGADCNLVLPPAQSFLMQVQKPPVPEEELAQALVWAVKDSLEYSVDEAAIDAFPVPEDSLRGRDPMMNVVGARKTIIREHLKLVEAAGLTTRAIDIAELSLRNIADRLAEPGKAISMIVVEDTVGTILVFKNSQLYLARQVTCDASVFQNSGDIQERQDAEGQLCLEIQRSLDYFESQLGQVSPQKILVAAGPGTASLKQTLIDTLGIAAEEARIDDIETGPSAALLRAMGAALREEE
jgi:MSHA biogenesis protein MshI